MGLDIRLPQITGLTEKEQLTQVKSYLYQLATQLQWGLKNIDTSSNTNTMVTPTARSQLAGTAGQTAGAEDTFNSIKSLIIKSADIVNAYYDEINKKLKGEYVAESAFGTYKEQTEQNIEANSTRIEQNYTNVQEVMTNMAASLDSLNYSIVDVTANIKSGLLYYNDDGVPVYGLEVGQKNVVNGVEVFNKFARFTAGRLSFYDQNGVEVAYISDYKLYITHAEVTGTLRLGGYIVDATRGLTFKWVGRS